jgi:hypothetical protein
LNLLPSLTFQFLPIHIPQRALLAMPHMLFVTVDAIYISIYSVKCHEFFSANRSQPFFSTQQRTSRPPSTPTTLPPTSTPSAGHLPRRPYRQATVFSPSGRLLPALTLSPADRPSPAPTCRRLISTQQRTLQGLHPRRPPCRLVGRRPRQPCQRLAGHHLCRPPVQTLPGRCLLAVWQAALPAGRPPPVPTLPENCSQIQSAYLETKGLQVHRG